MSQSTNVRSCARRVAAKVAPFELVLPVNFYVGDNHGQHPFMHVNSRYLLSHTLILRVGAESVPSYLKQGHGLSLLPPRGATTPNYSLNTHAPDQTSIRPRPLQCAIDLAAPDQCYSKPK